MDFADGDEEWSLMTLTGTETGISDWRQTGILSYVVMAVGCKFCVMLNRELNDSRDNVVSKLELFSGK